MKKRSLKVLLVLVSVSISFIVEAQKSKNSSLPRYSPKYSFEPPKRDSVASANVTIALMKPMFMLGDYNGNTEEPYTQFSKKMVDDIEALLTAKGYKVRGPFSTRDEMVFNDKQNSDFTLEIAINYNAEVQRNWKDHYNIFASSYTFDVKSGNVNITASLVITAKSNFTGEKLWKKSLDLGTKSFSYVGSVRWDSQSLSFRRELTEDNNFWNPYTKLLEGVYTESLEMLWKQFDVNELRSVADEARKEKAGRKN
jgi:hypothetical protein